jgi:hypothetical protein
VPDRAECLSDPANESQAIPLLIPGTTIMKVELSEQERQALAETPNQAIEVIDPISGRIYVLLNLETYENYSGKKNLSRPIERPDLPSTPSSDEGKPLRQRLRDLPFPPEVTEAAQRYCKKLNLWGSGYRKEMFDRFLLQWYYGGKYIGYLSTPDGPIIVAAGRLDEAFDRQLAAVTPEERRQVILEPMDPWNDSVTLILSPGCHYED